MVEMTHRTNGVVIEVKKLWWIKINTKPVRKHALDGALFPHTITVKYMAGGVAFAKKIFVRARFIPPEIGDMVHVFYNVDNPSKCKIEFNEKEQLL